MFNANDRVRHTSRNASFGEGTVLRTSRGATVLVEWDTHRVERAGEHLSTRQSHVNASSLELLSTTAIQRASESGLTR